MKNIALKDLETERLLIKKPKMDEQVTLWNILRKENVNKYYFPTPDRIFLNNNLKKDNIEDLKMAREIFIWHIYEKIIYRQDNTLLPKLP